MAMKNRRPKLHWYLFDCHCIHPNDNYTIAPGLVTCGICLRHVKRVARLKAGALKVRNNAAKKKAGV